MMYTIVSDKSIDDKTEGVIREALHSDDPEHMLRERVKRFERIEGNEIYIGAATRCVMRISV